MSLTNTDKYYSNSLNKVSESNSIKRLSDTKIVYLVSVKWLQMFIIFFFILVLFLTLLWGSPVIGYLCIAVAY